MNVAKRRTLNIRVPFMEFVRGARCQVRQTPASSSCVRGPGQKKNRVVCTRSSDEKMDLRCYKKTTKEGRLKFSDCISESIEITEFKILYLVTFQIIILAGCFFSRSQSPLVSSLPKYDTKHPFLPLFLSYVPT